MFYNAPYPSFSDCSAMGRNPPATSLLEVELVDTTEEGAATNPKYDAELCSLGGSDEDLGEDRLLEDFGPARVNRNVTVTRDADTVVMAPGWEATSCFDRHITDDHGLRRRIVYDPTEVARQLQFHHCSGTGEGWRQMVCMLETALDSSRPVGESLLICKAVTDAFLVSRGLAAAADDGNHGGELFVQSLRQTWQHTVEQRGENPDERRHTSADLHLVASWFQAWEASDCTSNQSPTIDEYELHGMLPGNWAWVLDHLETAGAQEGLHLQKEIEFEAAEERQLRLPKENWALSDLKRSLQLVSDCDWFQEGERMIDLKVLGPSRPSTFRRELSGVPGAIYGCLKDLAGVTLTPPTFRMYTTGDILEALGADVVMRFRSVGEGAAGEVLRGEVELENERNPHCDHEHDSVADAARRRQVVSLVEVQLTWVGGYTHVLGWLDSMEV